MRALLRLGGDAAARRNQSRIAGRVAIESVRRSPARNAIRYLARNIERGVITPLTFAYRDAILRRTGAADLGEAERLVLRSVDGLVNGT